MKFLTFDIEDWFHILDNPKTKYPYQWELFPKRIDIGVDIILELCSRHKVKGVFFCLGWIAEKYPEVVLKIHKAGHIIGTHGYAHQLVYEQNKEEFRRDILKSINIIESITGEKVDAYRAPGFSITKKCLWAFDILVECGIRYDSSIFTTSRAHGGLKDIEISEPFNLITLKGSKIIELPISTQSFIGKKFAFSGGGYFRITPFLLLRRWFKNANYVMTYFHPRDFDSQQPMIPGLNFIRIFKSYYVIPEAKMKLDHLIYENTFQNTLPKRVSATFDLGLIE